MKAVIAAVALLMAVLCMSTGASANQIIIGAGQNHTTVHAEINDNIIVQLEGPRSTGHQGMLDFWPGPAVIQNGKPSFDPNGHGHGKAGIYNFPFVAVQKGLSTIRLEFARHWEANPQKSFIVTISVQN
eukprot:TRINITY_DN4526_c0_g1_i2.p1 TRINITY_DN4526_c0_g1~~TRINITY_DN4526_c0_g1_i2.p1  ORF type:complete len:129 (+),score=33.36 TRINITY_DN4526_c0_g1_i2:61-447(+)